MEEQAMADTVRTAQYFKMKVPDKPGECARILEGLREAGVNLLAFSGFPTRRRAQLDFVLADTSAFQTLAKKMKLKIKGPKTCFVVQGRDRPGAVADTLSQLAAAKINVTAIQAVCAGGDRYGAFFWVKPLDLKKAAKVLGIR
jgi:hypothetical protein